MKPLTRMIVSVTLLSFVGISFWLKNTYAFPITNQYPITQARDTDRESNDDVEEQQEASQLQRLAKITPQQAQQIAEKAVGGQAQRVKLDNENGNLIYSVEIEQQEVNIDAGNGQVLYVQKTTQDNEAMEEASRPRSSIQVPHSQDNEHETNDDN